MSGSPNIRFRWPWGHLWAVIAILLPAILMSGDLFGSSPSELQAAIRWWIRVFVFFEMVGVAVNAVDHDGVEEIRTLSQLLQRVGAIDESKARWERWWKGWSAAVTMYVVVLSISASWALWGVGPALPVGGRAIYVNSLVVGPGVFCWLLFHFLRRYRYG